MSATARLLLLNKDNSQQLHRTVDGGLLHRVADAPRNQIWVL